MCDDSDAPENIVNVSPTPDSTTNVEMSETNGVPPNVKEQSNQLEIII